MSYQKNNWIARVGTGLNKWRDLISNTLFELVNEPDSVTIAGTPFQAAWLNNIENAAATGSDYNVPDSVVSQQINITTSDDDISRLFIRINTTVSGGSITINRNGNGPKPLVEPDGVTPVTELSQDDKFYEIIEDATVFFLAPSGGNEWGGLQFVVDEESGRLYSCDNNTDLIYELDIYTNLVISSVGSIGIDPLGVGGINSRLYHNDRTTDLIYELDTDTKLPLSNAVAPDILGNGIGGILARVYFTGNSNDLIYELDPNTKLQLSSASSPGGSPGGIGGTSDNRLFHTDYGSDTIYELDKDTKLQTNSAAAPGTNTFGCGGTNSRFYAIDPTSGLIYLMDKDTLLEISNNPQPGTTGTGVGGLKTEGGSIAIKSVLFNGTEYELTDDSCFRVSGVSV